MSFIVPVIFLFHVMGFFSSINAIMETRTPQGAVAWAVFLITFPYVAVPSYWVLGRSRFQGYVSARNDSESDLADMATDIRQQLLEYHFRDVGESVIPSNRVAETLTGSPYVTGNAIELLIDGGPTFFSILDGINRAEDYILFQFFIIKDDEIGRQVKSALAARSRDGVRVYLLYDEIGSRNLPSAYIGELRDAGVHVTAFHTRKGPRNRFQLNFRNHRKLVVIDGSELWTGGHNVGDEYLGRNPKFGHWRDTHVHISGPVVLEGQFSFIEDWYWATGELPELYWTAVPSSTANIPVLVAPTGPADDLETASLLFAHAINTAENRIWIASPYFVPDEGVMHALLLAGIRGVDVRILIPEKPDHLGSYLAAWAYQAKVAQTGVKFYRYQAGFMHQKVLLLDDYLASVGTANFDNRSFRLNFEISAIVADRDFAAAIEKMLLEDFGKSALMEENAIMAKPYWFRLAANVARLTAPVQ